MKSYAVLADIHGNIWALEAVLADAARRGFKDFLNLGDTVYGPLEPGETAARLMELRLVSVRGNEDLMLFAASPDPGPTLIYTLESMTEKQRGWLESTHPQTAIIDNGLFLCHGTPASDTTYLLEKVDPRGGFLKEPAELEAELADVPQQVILCGHSHVPRLVRLPAGRLILNPGSVGLQAYTDDPPPHKMETGSPEARYAVLIETPAGWRIEHIAVPYAWDKAARRARRSNRPDWGSWLESGRA